MALLSWTLSSQIPSSMYHELRSAVATGHEESSLGEGPIGEALQQPHRSKKIFVEVGSSATSLVRCISDHL